MSTDSASKGVADYKPVTTTATSGYLYVEPPVDAPDPIGTSEPYWSFLKSPQFGMIVVASCASILVRSDFQTMTWNMIAGQILTLIGSGAASFGLLNKVSKNLSTK